MFIFSPPVPPPSSPARAVFATASTEELQALLDADSALTNAYDAWSGQYSAEEYRAILSAGEIDVLCSQAPLVASTDDPEADEFAAFLNAVCDRSGEGCSPGWKFVEGIGCVPLNYLKACNGGQGYIDAQGGCVGCLSNESFSEIDGKCIPSQVPSCSEYGPGYQAFQDPATLEWFCAGCGDNETLTSDGYCVCQGGYARQIPGDFNSPCVKEDTSSGLGFDTGPSEATIQTKKSAILKDPTQMAPGVRPPCSPPNVPDPFGAGCVAPEVALAKSEAAAACKEGGGTYDGTTCFPGDSATGGTEGGDEKDGKEGEGKSNTALYIGVAAAVALVIGAVVVSSSSSSPDSSEPATP